MQGVYEGCFLGYLMLDLVWISTMIGSFTQFSLAQSMLSPSLSHAEQ